MKTKKEKENWGKILGAILIAGMAGMGYLFFGIMLGLNTNACLVLSQMFSGATAIILTHERK